MCRFLFAGSPWTPWRLHCEIQDIWHRLRCPAVFGKIRIQHILPFPEYRVPIRQKPCLSSFQFWQSVPCRRGKGFHCLDRLVSVGQIRVGRSVPNVLSGFSRPDKGNLVLHVRSGYRHCLRWLPASACPFRGEWIHWLLHSLAWAGGRAGWRIGWTGLL